MLEMDYSLLLALKDVKEKQAEMEQEKLRRASSS